MLITLPATKSHHTVFVAPGYSYLPGPLLFAVAALIVLCHAGTSGVLVFVCHYLVFHRALGGVVFSGLSLGQISSGALIGLPFYRVLLSLWGLGVFLRSSVGSFPMSLR